VDDHAPFQPNRGPVKPVVNFTESRTGGRLQQHEVGNLGYASVGMTRGEGRLRLEWDCWMERIAWDGERSLANGEL
jgi:hypothetical protein